MSDIKDLERQLIPKQEKCKKCMHCFSIILVCILVLSIIIGVIIFFPFSNNSKRINNEFLLGVSYKNLSTHFNTVKDKNLEEIGDLIGGNVKTNIDGGWFKNGCAIRMSYAFNYSGEKIQFKKDKTVSGGDNYYYYYRVKDFKEFLENNYSENKITKDFKDKKGVIIFEDCSWTDATGHIDLFDGKKVVGTDYSSECNSKTLYEF